MRQSYPRYTRKALVTCREVEAFSFTFPEDLKYSVDIHARRRETST